MVLCQKWRNLHCHAIRLGNGFRVFESFRRQIHFTSSSWFLSRRFTPVFATISFTLIQKPFNPQNISSIPVMPGQRSKSISLVPMGQGRTAGTNMGHNSNNNYFNNYNKSHNFYNIFFLHKGKKWVIKSK